jgi:amphi-Trp domain-containing protein
MSKNNSKSSYTFEHESLQDKSNLIQYLAVISEGFNQGEIHLANEEEEINLQPQGLARLKIKAKHAKNHQEIRLTIAWTTELDELAEPSKLIIQPHSKKSKKKKPNH